MTLEEWIALTPEERNSIRLQWNAYDEISSTEPPWRSIFDEALRRFVDEFKDHSLINYINGSALRAGFYEPTISVTTALHCPQTIEELPDRYMTFRVLQEPINDNKDGYLRYWNILFAELVGWMPQRIADWAKKWDDDLNGKNCGMFYHEDPFYYVLPEVLTESGVRLPWNESRTVCHEVKFAIECEGSQPIWESPYCWENARKRINAILEKWGGKLPTSKNEAG